MNRTFSSPNRRSDGLDVSDVTTKLAPLGYRRRKMRRLSGSNCAAVSLHSIAVGARPGAAMTKSI
jgi:hypothetical protein